MAKIVLGNGKLTITGKDLAYEFEADPPIPPDPPPVDNHLWSNPKSWPSGAVPVEGEAVTIPDGLLIYQDINTPPLGSLNVKGLLAPLPDAGNLLLLTATMHITGNGKVRVGEEGKPFPKHNSFTVELFGPRSNVDDHHDRGLMYHLNGAWEVFGDVSRNHLTVITESVTAGSRTIKVEDATGWQVGDELIVGVTHKYGYGAPERVFIKEIAGKQITFDPPLKYNRWGSLLYATDSGIQVTPGTWTKKPHPENQEFVDKRARVSNLTRNVMFQGSDDAIWKSDGFGAHMMAMDNTNRTHFQGLRIRRSGQRGILGRYGYHRHLNSWNVDDGSFKGPVQNGDGYLYRCVFDQSVQRGTVIHATEGIEIAECVYADIEGQAWMLEDGVEENNSIYDCAFYNIDGSSKPLMEHERKRSLDNSEVFGASALWHSNPNNNAYRNYANYCNGVCWWGSFSRTGTGVSGPLPLGKGGKVEKYPSYIPIGEVHGNIGQSNRGSAHALFGAAQDDKGNIADSLMYTPTESGNPNIPSAAVFAHIYEMEGYDCNGGLYRHRANFEVNKRWKGCDNYGQDLAGATSDALGGDDAQLFAGLFIGHSIADPSRSKPPPPLRYDDTVTGLRSGSAGYHSSYMVHENAWFDYPMEIRSGMYPPETAGSGVFKLDDNYLRPVEKGTKRNRKNLLHNCFPAYLVPPPNLCGSDKPPLNRHFTTAGATYDNGSLGGPEGSWRVHDVPFLTFGANILARPAPAGKNGVSVDGEYIGILGFSTGFNPSPYQFTGAMLSELFLMDGTYIDKWDLPEGTGGPFPWMRHAALRVNPLTWVRHSFPGHAPSHWTAFQLHCVHGNEKMMSLPIATDSPIAELAYMAGNDGVGGGYRRNCRAAASLAEVRNGAGDLYWLDVPAKEVHFKVRGNLPYPFIYDPDSDGDLYKPYAFKMRTAKGVYGVKDT